MPTPSQMFWALAVPTVLVGLLLAAAWRAWDRGARADGRWIAAPAVALGFVISYWNLARRPQWPPGSGDVVEWLFYAAIALGFLGLAQTLARPRRWLAGIVLVLLWRMLARAILWPQIPSEISANAAEISIDLAALLALTWWAVFGRLAEPGGAAASLVLGIVTAGCAVTAVSWHILLSGFLAGSLALLCLPAFALSIWIKRFVMGPGYVMTLALLVQAVMLHAYFYTDDRFSGPQQFRIALLMFSPILGLAGDLPGIRGWSAGKRLAARVIPVLIVAGLVAGMGMHDYFAADTQAPSME